MGMQNFDRGNLKDSLLANKDHKELKGCKIGLILEVLKDNQVDLLVFILF